jgi:hypothetical protein
VKNCIDLIKNQKEGYSILDGLHDRGMVIWRYGMQINVQYGVFVGPRWAGLTVELPGGKVCPGENAAIVKRIGRFSPSLVGYLNLDRRGFTPLFC